jgi:uncharacterized protein
MRLALRHVGTLAAALMLGGGAVDAIAEIAVPPLAARVTDLSGTLSGGAVNRIESKLKDLETRKGSQLAVLVVPTTQPEEIEQFGIRVADAWKLGRKGVDDGAVFIIAKDDRRMRIEVGRGLEGALPDVVAKRIIADTVTPYFKQGDFDGGVEAGVDQLIGVVNGEPLPEPDKKWESGGGWEPMLPLFLVVGFVASGILRAIFGRFFGSAATGGVVGALAWFLSHWIPVGLGVGLLGFLFSLLLGSSRGWTNRGPGGLGGWGGGLGGGGFGGGGFGGGGGGFGGGGASGSW